MLEQALLLGFLALAAALWLSVFGYVAVLLVLAAGRGVRRAGRAARPARTDGELPAIAVVVPVRNEEGLIAAKLADLRRTDYPRQRLTTVVVDGGSTDRTAALVEAERAGGAAIELLRVPTARGKADQLNAAFASLRHELIVVTDVDAALDPACIRTLVDMLLDDPSTAVVGARIRPATRLLEERLHWWLLNSLWWLEGEALRASAVSGVCYALRRTAVLPLPADCAAEDIRLALSASARQLGVRLCRDARATELRVPQTAREFLRFRLRRGAGYFRELRRAGATDAPAYWHLARRMRLFQFLALPGLAAGAGAGALALCATPLWRWAIAAALAFAAPALAALWASRTLWGERRRWWRLSLAAGRLAGLTWLALLVLPRTAPPPLAQGE
jgi:cellulose synthase/poly-beta-1,6-N-acetylglucosamine synthase-like glycosyltransferase